MISNKGSSGSGYIRIFITESFTIHCGDRGKAFISSPQSIFPVLVLSYIEPLAMLLYRSITQDPKG
jgi:hypothetical protein